MADMVFLRKKCVREEKKKRSVLERAFLCEKVEETCVFFVFESTQHTKAQISWNLKHHSVWTLRILGLFFFFGFSSFCFCFSKSVFRCRGKELHELIWERKRKSFKKVRGGMGRETKQKENKQVQHVASCKYGTLRFFLGSKIPHWFFFFFCFFTRNFFFVPLFFFGHVFFLK